MFYVTYTFRFKDEWKSERPFLYAEYVQTIKKYIAEF